MLEFKDFESNGGAVFCAEQTSGSIVTFQKTLPDGTFAKKNIRVIETGWDEDYVYRFQKTQIKANGGAAGLIRFLSNYSSWKDFSATWASNVYNAAFDHVKAAKI